MAQLLRYAYLAELFLWIPLAYFIFTLPSARRWLMAPLVASVLAGVYESYMTFVWEPKVVAPIRVDIFLVLLVTCAANTISGLMIAAFSSGRAESKRLMAAAAVCLSIPLLALAGYGFMLQHTKELDADFARGRKYRFEAAFRDDATQKRVFGEIGANPWSGYYVAGSDDDRLKYLVINDAGQFWLYHSMLYSYAGTGAPSATDTNRWEGKGDGRTIQNLSVALQRQADGPYMLDVDFGFAPKAQRKAVPIQKAAPPRFPQPASPTDEVRFLGVFSATYGERDRDFWLVQAWLWESKGEVWGRYVHDNYARGQRRDFIFPEELRARCEEQCKVLTFATGRGPRKLERVSDDAYRGRYDSPEQDVTLKRGEILPGFLLDLAPLATARQNRDWLNAVLVGQSGSWEAPAK